MLFVENVSQGTGESVKAWNPFKVTASECIAVLLIPVVSFVARTLKGEDSKFDPF